MRICVVGAGSIGGMLGVKLSVIGEDVTLIARGPHLEAIKARGLKLIMNDGEEFVAKDVKATANIREAGEQDLVILGIKAHQIAPIAEDIRTLVGPDTMVMTTQNGIPWWYFHKHGGEYEGTPIKSVDPDGRIGANIDADHIIGSIAYPAAEIAEPGVIRHIEGIRFPVGELDGAESARVEALSELLVKAGFKSPVLTDFRSEMWLKLWGNLCFNPISALTHATLVDICQFPLTHKLAEDVMTEAQEIGSKLGATFRVPLEKRIAGAEKVGKHKTSMLQDVENGKGLELDAMVGAVVELGEITNTPTPCTSALYACAKLLNRTIEQERVCIRAQRTEDR
ncbi:MAG: 2-dehydropantoate 2-reductase [Gammaproteobacteria bacterium]